MGILVRLVVAASFVAVSSRSVAAQSAPERTLATSPFLDIGGAGVGRELLKDLVGMVLLPGGRLAVAEGSTKQIIIYDLSGKRLTTFGRAGGGPGEFQSYIRGFGRYRGDSLWVADLFTRRVSIFDDHGRFGRSFVVDVPMAGADVIAYGDFPHVLAALGDGTMIVETPYSLPLNAPPGERWYETRIIRTGVTGTRGSVLGVFPALPVIVRTPGPRGERVFPVFSSLGIAVAAVDSGIVVGGGPDYAIRFVSAAGAIRTVSSPLSGDRVSPEHIARFEVTRSEALKRSSPTGEGGGRGPAPTYANHFPPFAGILSAARGQVFLDGYAVPGAATKLCRIVRLSDGMITLLRVPSRLTVQAFNGDSVFGIWRDDDDVESIRGYRLVKVP